MEDLQIVHLDPLSLKPYPHNAKTHPPEQVAGIAYLIEKYGMDVPIVVNERHEILKGHGRREACILLSRKTVPCIVRTGLTVEEERAIRIGDNKIAESPWDYDKLRIDFTDLKDSGLDLPQTTGFSAPDIETIRGGWQTDFGSVEKVNKNLDGIKVTIKVICAQALRGTVKDLIEKAINDVGIPEVEVE